ncbi:MAG: bacterial transcriptional activator domain-containing protein [Desulfobacterales bacterium]|nr:bacterial transcriptional activator domain-containing protein [Desulfobacterales bacterium]
MSDFKEHINKEEYGEAEKLFLDEADIRLAQDEFAVILDSIKAFPEKYRRSSTVITFYYYISKHLQDPYGTRSKLTELISPLESEKDYDRVATIHTVLLINYMYFHEGNDEIRGLSSTAQDFLNRSGSRLSTYQRKKLGLWMNLSYWWLRDSSEAVTDKTLEVEEAALELKDSAALLILRLFLAEQHHFNGHYKKAISEFEKAERLINDRKAKPVYAPFVLYWKSLTLIYMRQFEAALKEAEKGLAVLDENSIFCDYLNEVLFLYNLFMHNIEATESLKEKILYGPLAQNAYFRIHFIYSGQMIQSYFLGDKEKVAYYVNRIIEEGVEKYFSYYWPLKNIIFSETNVYIENYDIAIQTLEDVLDRISGNMYASLSASAYAMLAVIHDRKKDKKTAKNHFDLMQKVLIENDVEELQIIDNEMLEEIAVRSGSVRVQRLLQKRLKNESPILSKTVETDSDKADLPADHKIEIHALGALRIFVDGKEVPGTTLGRRKRLLDLLKLIVAFHETGLPRGIVYDLFWENYDQKSASNNLNVNLYRLRKLFDTDFISLDGDVIRLYEEVIWLDVKVFEENLRMGKIAARKGSPHQALKYFHVAHELYQGDFIENDLYDDLIAKERNALKKRYVDMLFTAMKLYLDEGDHHHALNYGQTLIRYLPYCEPAYRLLMMACALSGNRGELTALYKQLSAVLKRELNVEADSSTRQLLDDLQKGIILTAAMWQKEQL